MNIGWIDFSEKDRRMALDVIQIGMQQGTVDELGTGIISEAFSNYFFPGTSTIQTRAKYFFLVPYAMQETVRTPSVRKKEEALRVLDNIEEEMASILWRNSKGATGIIGQDNIRQGKWVKRTPTSIYWSGLRTLGFFNNPLGYSLSIAEYLNADLSQRKNMVNMADDNLGDEGERDDKDAGHGQYFEFWNLPYRPNWREELNINLTPDESKFFAEKIRTYKSGTLMEFLLDEKESINYDGFETMAESLKDKVDAKLGGMMQMALDFDQLLYLGTILFNLELSEDQNERAQDEWAKYRPQASAMAERVNLEAIFSSLGISNQHEYKFLTDLRDCLIVNTDDSIAQARKRIVKQAEWLKGGNSKLARKNEFDNQGWFGGNHLDYRFRNAKMILDDIKRGLGNV